MAPYQIDQNMKNELYIRALRKTGIHNWARYGEAMNAYNKAKDDLIMKNKYSILGGMLTKFIVNNAMLEDDGKTVHVTTASIEEDDAIAFIDELLDARQKLEDVSSTQVNKNQLRISDVVATFKVGDWCIDPLVCSGPKKVTNIWMSKEFGQMVFSCNNKKTIHSISDFVPTEPPKGERK